MGESMGILCQEIAEDRKGIIKMKLMKTIKKKKSKTIKIYN